MCVAFNAFREWMLVLLLLCFLGDDARTIAISHVVIIAICADTHTQCDVRLNKTYIHHCYFSLHFLSIAFSFYCPLSLCVRVCVSPDICHTTSIVNNYFISAFGHLYMQPSEIMCKMCLAVVFCLAICVTHRLFLFSCMRVSGTVRKVQHKNLSSHGHSIFNMNLATAE